MKPKKKRVRSGFSTTKEQSVVSSKIEHTKDSVKDSGKDTPQVASLKAYRKTIGLMTKEIKVFALGLCKDNLLSVKMALMGAVREVEEMMKERRQ